MSTTLIFIELLAAGTLSSLAAILLLIALGLNPKVFADLADRQVVAIIAALAIVYPLGIVIDGLADKLFAGMDKHFKKKYALEDEHSLFSLFAKGRGNNFAERYFEYSRIRTRVVRSFILNAFLVLVTGVACAVRLDFNVWWIGAWVVFWGGAALVAYWSLRQIRDSWYRMLGVAWEVWPPKKQAKPDGQG